MLGTRHLEYTPLNDFIRGKVMYSQCGRNFATVEAMNDYILYENQTAPVSIQKGPNNCPLRFVWGNAAMGLCDHFPGMPCVYFTTLRDPLSRALSDYFYFCVDGSEGRKKWTEDMIAKGECNVGPLAWFRQQRTSPLFYQERLTRSCDAKCGVEASLRNLFHPCVRYLVVEKFNDGLERLKQAFSGVFDRAIDEFLQTPSKRINRRGHGVFKLKLKTRVISNSTLDTLREWLREDYMIYNEAVARYEEQWDKPIESCNEFSPKLLLQNSASSTSSSSTGFVFDDN